MFPGEIRYLDIRWVDRNTVASIVVSNDALGVVRCGSDPHEGHQSQEPMYSVDTLVFPASGHHVGICLDSTLGAVSGLAQAAHPEMVLSNGRKRPLTPVSAPGSSDVWWILAGDWSDKGCCYYSELYRTVGRVQVKLPVGQLLIDNRAVNFSTAELEHYLNDFKNSLWRLVLDENSAVSLSAPGSTVHTGSLLDEATIHGLTEFCQAAEEVLKALVSCLEESSGKLPRRSIRPSATTFRELISRPDAPTFTGRIRTENVDTPDNRFAHFCVTRVYDLFAAVERMTHSRVQAISYQVEALEKRIQLIDETTDIKVDPQVFDAEIRAITSQRDHLNNKIKLATPRMHRVFPCHRFVLGKRYKSGTSWFVRSIDGNQFPDSLHQFAVLTLDGLAQTDNPDSLSGLILDIWGALAESCDVSNTGKNYVRFSFDEIGSFQLVDLRLERQLEQLNDQRRKLEKSDWRRAILADERRAMREDRDEACASKAHLLALLDSQKALRHLLPSASARLRRARGKFTEKKVGLSREFPNSMVFVSNTKYALFYRNYKRLLEKLKLSQGTLDTLLKFNNIGLVNIANLYERWCLIRIVNILKDIYGFIPERGWQSRLINAVANNDYDIEIPLFAEGRQQTIVLSYEKELPNRRRPDFVIDLQSNSYSLSGGVWYAGDKKSSRLVLDAKFRGNDTAEKLNELVTELYSHKNYSENGCNQVFIIHPVINAQSTPVSPLNWGRSSDYGQECGHKYGSVFISPVLGLSAALHDLQRLIGMFLQANSVALVGRPERGELSAWTNLCCIGCGNTADETLRVTYDETKTGKDVWRIFCERCRLHSVKTCCQSCGRDLYKNGNHWTYHRTRVMQTSNVVCPDCQTFL